MSTRAPQILAAGVIALLLTGAWLVFGGARDGATPTPLQLAPASVAPDAGEIEARAVELRRSGDDGDAALVDAAFERTEADVDDEPVDLAGRLVRVLDAASGEPVDRAEVFFADRRSVEAHRREHDISRYAERAALTVHCGERVVTGRDGRAVLPDRELERPLFAARAGDRFGVAENRRRRRRGNDDRDAEITIRVTPDERVTIQVLGPDDAPAPGISVSVLQTDGGRRRNRLWREETGDDGRVVVPHFQLERRTGRRAGEHFVALLEVPAPVPIAEEFAGAPAQRETVVLRAPVTAPLTLRVVGPAGRPVRARMSISVDPVSPQPTDVPVPDAERDVWTDKAAGAPTARFPAVALGTELRARLRFRAERDIDWRSAPFTSAVTDDADFVHTVRTPDWLLLIDGRLIDERHGEPLGEQRVEWLVRAAGRPIERLRVESFADGSFELPLRPGEDAERAPFELELRTRDAEGVELGARVALPHLDPAERLALDDLRIGPLPLIASGRVVDERGEPVRRASVHLETRRTLTVPRERTGWFAERLTRTNSDAAGRFELRGSPDSGRPLRLTARRRGHADASAEIARGSRDLRLVMPRLGGFVAGFTVPDWLGGRAVRARLRPVAAGADGERPSGKVERVRRRGTTAAVRFRELRPGPYDLGVELHGFAAPLVTVRGIVVEPGETSRDPRADAIDLRGLIHRYEIRTLDAASGRPLEDTGGVVLGQLRDTGDDAPRWVGFPWRDGNATFITPQAQVPIAVLGTGLRPIRLTATPGRTDVLIPQLQPAVITLPGLRESVGERRVRVSMVLVGDTGLPTSLRAVDQRRGRSRSLPRASLGKSGGDWLDAAGDPTVRVPLALDGEYDVVIRVYPEGRRGRPESRPVARVPVRLAGPHPTRHVVHVPPQTIAEILDELASR